MLRDPNEGRHRLLIAFVAIVGFAAYASTLDVYFVKDDLSMGMFTDGEGSFHFKGWWEQLGWPTERTWDDIWRPIPALSWAMDYILFGPDPVAFHLGNILLHCLCGVLLYWLVNRLTSFRNPLAGFFAGLLFVVYPLFPESVVWLTQRTVLMGLAFSLLALILYDVWLHRGQRRHLALAWTFVVLATLSREHGLPLPASICTMALLLGPRRPFKRRVREVLLQAGIGAAFIAIYFAFRYWIFGQFTGSYSGYASNEAYSEANRVFERFGETIRICLVPGNRDWFEHSHEGGGATWLALFTGFQISVAAMAIFWTVRAMARNREALGFLALMGVFTFTSWIPVFQVFWVNENLLNARSSYHIMALFIGWFGAALVNPWAPPGGGAWSRWIRVICPGICVVVYTLALQVNLTSWHGGGAQVRGLQEAVVQEAQAHGRETIIVVFEVPSEYKGCPTLDQYMPALCAPPFLVDRVSAFPFVAGKRSQWPSLALDPKRELRRWLGEKPPRPIRFYTAAAGPAALRNIFGAQEPPLGERPPQPSFPEDGAMVVVGPQGWALFPAGVTPVPAIPMRQEQRDLEFLTQARDNRPSIPVQALPQLVLSFTAAPDITRFVVHLQTPALEDLPLTLEVGRNAERQGSLVTYRIGSGTLEPEADPVPWPPYQEWIDGILPLVWRIEAKDGDGRSLGLSETSRLVILDAR